MKLYLEVKHLKVNVYTEILYVKNYKMKILINII